MWLLAPGNLQGPLRSRCCQLSAAGLGKGEKAGNGVHPTSKMAKLSAIAAAHEPDTGVSRGCTFLASWGEQENEEAEAGQVRGCSKHTLRVCLRLFSPEAVSVEGLGWPHPSAKRRTALQMSASTSGVSDEPKTVDHEETGNACTVVTSTAAG